MSKPASCALVRAEQRLDCRKVKGERHHHAVSKRSWPSAASRAALPSIGQQVRAPLLNSGLLSARSLRATTFRPRDMPRNSVTPMSVAIDGSAPAARSLSEHLLERTSA